MIGISERFDRVWNAAQLDPQEAGNTIRAHYNEQAKMAQKAFAFLNFGYAPPGFRADQSGEALNNALCSALYHHAASRTDIAGKAVLEIGSGLGAGAKYVCETFSPKTMVGLDFAQAGVALVNALPSMKCLEFVCGDACKLPFEDDRFDVILNIESSHCYPSITRFLGEVFRCLKPKGLFSFCDIRTTAGWADFLDEAEAAGLKLLEQVDITAEVVQALDLTSPWKEEVAQGLGDPEQQDWFLEITGTRNRSIYNDFQSGNLLYYSGLFQSSEPE